jgi:hypothetical protein
MTQNEEADKNTVKQVEGEHTGLLATRKILESLLLKIEEKTIQDAVNQSHQDNIKVKFGDYNSGSQIGVNNAPIGSMHFGQLKK